jgi:putative protease
MEWSIVGQVTHYFDRIGVAAMTLNNRLSVGDRIAFVKGEELLFEQDVASMQIEHESVASARAGDDIGLKVIHEVKAGVNVYKQV